ncbi:collagen-like protein, partial [Bacillus thuringiensis]|nr:collagen-like protein [Bacillus thuringiensis]
QGPQGPQGPVGPTLTANNIYVANPSTNINVVGSPGRNAPIPMTTTVTRNGTILTLASPGISVSTTGTYYIIAKGTIESPVNARAAIALALNGILIPQTSSLANLPFGSTPISGTQVMTYAIVNISASQVITVVNNDVENSVFGNVSIGVFRIG